MMSGIFQGRALFRCSRAPEGAAFLADPLALSPLSLPDARWRTGPRAGRPSASRSCEGAVVVDPLRFSLGAADRLCSFAMQEHQGLCPLVPEAE